MIKSTQNFAKLKYLTIIAIFILSTFSIATAANVDPTTTKPTTLQIQNDTKTNITPKTNTNPESSNLPKGIDPNTDLVTINGTTYKYFQPDNGEPFLVDVNSMNLYSKYQNSSYYYQSNNDIVKQIQHLSDTNLSTTDRYLFSLLPLESYTSSNSYTGDNSSFSVNTTMDKSFAEIMSSLPNYGSQLNSLIQSYENVGNLNNTFDMSSSSSTGNPILDKFVDATKNYNGAITIDNNTGVLSAENNISLSTNSVIEKLSTDGDLLVHDKNMTTPDAIINEQEVIQGTGSMWIDNGNLSNAFNIPIPVVDKASTTNIPMTTQTFTVIFTLHKELPGFNWHKEYNFLLVQFRSWAKFEASFTLEMPVKFTVTYPTQVVKGQPFTYYVSAKGFDIPNHDEFHVDIVLDIGFSVDHIWFEWQYNWVKFWYYGLFTCWCWTYKYIKTWFLSTTWRSLLGNRIDFEYHNHATYKTPMYGQWALIPLYQLDVLRMISDAVNNNKPPDNASMKTSVSFNALKYLLMAFQAGFGLGARMWGDVIYAHVVVGINNDNNDQGYFPRDVYIRRASDVSTNTISAQATSLSNTLYLKLTKLKYTIQKVTIDPYIFVGVRNFQLGPITVPLGNLLPSFAPYYIFLPGIGLPGFSITDSQILRTNQIKVVQGNYDFSVSATEVKPDPFDVQLGKVTSRDRRYAVTIQSNSGYDDEVTLTATNLPAGYTTNLPQTISVHSTGPHTVYFYVYGPRDDSLLNSGTFTFNVVARSKIKTDYSYPNPTVTKPLSFTVRPYINYDFSVTNDISSPIPITYGSSIQINYQVANVGNVNDNYKINGTLHLKNDVLYSNYVTVAAKGVYSNSFTIKFSKNDLFPEAGIYEFDLVAQSTQKPLLVKEIHLFVNFTKYFELSSSMTPLNTTIESNWKSDFILTVHNLGNAMDNYSIKLQTPPGFENYFSGLQNITNVNEMNYEMEKFTFSTLDPYSVPLGMHSFRLIIFSVGNPSANNIIDFNLTILPHDKIPPSITFKGSDQAIQTYRQSPLNLNISWEALDEHPYNFTVYINGSFFTTGNWFNNTPVYIPVQGVNNNLAVGMYNFTIVFTDGINAATDQRWVQILPPDTVYPILSNLSGPTTLPVNFAFKQQLKFKVVEDNLLFVDLTNNGTAVDSSQLFMVRDTVFQNTSYLTYNINPSSLAFGINYFTLTIVDQSNNTASLTVSISVTGIDSTIPTISQYPVSSVDQNHGQSLVINMMDANPYEYDLYIDSNRVINSTWKNGVITIPVDQYNMTVGDHNLELYVRDFVNNTNYFKWLFTVKDVDNPIIKNNLAPSYTFHEYNLSSYTQPSIVVFDTNPGTFSIFKNSTIDQSGIWSNENNTIIIPIRNLTLGTYNFTIVVKDSSGNSVSTQTQITVIDRLAPRIFSPDQISFDPFYVANWFEFYVLEEHQNDFQIYRNGTLVSSGSLVTNPFIVVDFSDLGTGNYNYTIVAYDSSNNVASSSVIVSIVDYTPPLVKRPADIIVSDKASQVNVFYQINESNPLDYTAYLNGVLYQINSLIGNVTLTFNVTDLNYGSNEVVMVVRDKSGFSHTTKSYIIKVDDVKPNLPFVGDVTFVKGQPGDIIYWNASDSNPANYTIYRNGIQLIQESWDGSVISLNVQGWSSGIQEIKIVIFDKYGNSASETIKVTIIDTAQLSTAQSKGIHTSDFSFLSLIPLFIGLISIENYRRKKIKNR